MCLSKCSSQSPAPLGQLALLSEAFLPLSAPRKTVMELRMWSRETTEQLLPPLEMCSGCWENRCYAEGNETIQQICLESFSEAGTAQLTRNWAVSRVVADLTELWPVKVLQMERCKTCKDWEVINEMEQKIRLDMNLRPRHELLKCFWRWCLSACFAFSFFLLSLLPRIWFCIWPCSILGMRRHAEVLSLYSQSLS